MLEALAAANRALAQPLLTIPPAPVQQVRPRPPSLRLNSARGRAAALAQTYMPVGRTELRNMVRLHAPAVCNSPRYAQGLNRMLPAEQPDEHEPRSGHAPSNAQGRHLRPASALQPVTSANARAVARCYELFIAQGTDPDVALHAARAHIVSTPRQRSDEAQMARRRLLEKRPIQLGRDAKIVGQTVDAGEQSFRAATARSGRPVSAAESGRSVTTPRPSTARPSTANKTRSGGAGPKDELLPFGYQTLGPIAAGAFSFVTRAKNLKTSHHVAVKTFLTRAKGGRRPNVGAVKSELACLERLRVRSHPHVANLIETHEGVYETHAILHLCGGGSLLRHLQTKGHGVGMDQPASVRIIAQVGSALTYMHETGVTHRDVKPGNVVFDDSSRANVRLVDFGFAALHRVQVQDGAWLQRRLKTICGSPAYMAPELLRGGQYLGPPVDVWALGALAYELLHNRPAFRAQSLPELNIRILKCSHEQISPIVSSQMRALIKKAFVVDPAERSRAKDITLLAEMLMQADDSTEAPAAEPPVERVVREWSINST
jgi:hypothetical protein